MPCRSSAWCIIPFVVIVAFSHDNVSKVATVRYVNVVDPERAIIKVQNYLPATNMLAQTTLRAVQGQHEPDEMLSERKKLSTDIQGILESGRKPGASRSATWKSAPWSRPTPWCAPSPIGR